VQQSHAIFAQPEDSSKELHATPYVGLNESPLRRDLAKGLRGVT